MNLDNYKDHQKILVAVDCIVLGFDGTQLNALLIQREFAPEKGKWSLMGGFIRNEEDARLTAARVLYELTGMKDLYMQQLHTFTEVDRDTADRVISIAYLSVIKISDYKKNPCQHESQWFPLTALPALIFDHTEMIEKAKDFLRRNIETELLGFELLPRKFTIRQLRSLYEAIYEMPLDQRNFAKKITSLNILNKLNEKEKSGSKKGSYFYNFNNENYAREKPSRIKLLYKVN